MPINRGPFNALVDDDGSGTTGTPWNKARIADVILDPVDAALTGLSLDPLITSTVCRGTADGADNSSVVLVGGGNPGASAPFVRGGYVKVYGNEAAGKPGYVEIVAGQVASSVINLYRGDGQVAVGINGTTGATTIAYSATVTTGGLTVSAGGLTVSAGLTTLCENLRFNKANGVNAVTTVNTASYLGVGGGPDVNQNNGGWMVLGGNSCPFPGAVHLGIGNVGGSEFKVYRANGSYALMINSTATYLDGWLYMTSSYPNIACSANNNTISLCGGTNHTQGTGAVITVFGVDSYGAGTIQCFIGARDAGNFVVYDAYGRNCFQLYGSSGQVAFSTVAANAATWNSTYAYGGYHNYQKNGTTYGYIGDGWALGVTGESIMCIRAIKSLYLKSDVGLITAPDVYNSTTGSPNNVNVDPTGNIRRGNVSSRRYKRDIVPLDGWRFLLDLQPVSFEHLGEPGIRRVGLVAEDVADVDPRFAIRDAQGRPDEVAYTHMTAPLIAAIQELHARLSALERTATDGTL